MQGSDMELWQLDATDQAALVQNGKASPRDLLDSAIARINETDPQVEALVDSCFDRACAEADGALTNGPFRGVPMLLKDAVQYSAGDRYQHGTTFLRDHEYYATTDSELVRRYREAGFIILGRTKVPEMTLSPTTEPLAHGPCHNPWNRNFSAGGSSGGSAAAVASGMVPVAHGNDMGGSLRIPASCCGLVGLKPSRHRTSIAPYGEYWGPLTHEHVITRTVRDSAAVLDATAGPVPGELHCAPPPSEPWLTQVGQDVAPLRVGLILDNPFSGGVDRECSAAAQDLARKLEGWGHRVEPMSGAPLGSLTGMAGLSTIVSTGIALSIERWEAEIGMSFSSPEPYTQSTVEAGRSTSGTALMRAVEDLAQWSRDIGAAYASADILVSPTLPEPPPHLGTCDPLQPIEELQHKLGAMASFAAPFDATGQPAISLPVAHSENGLPIGVQLIARYGREDLLFQLAAMFEQEYGWFQRWPDLPAGPDTT